MGRHEEELAAAQLEATLELHAVLRGVANELGTVAQYFRAPADNATLYAGSVTLDANGQFSKDWPIAYAAVAITNLSNTAATVAGDGLQSAAPVHGPGVFVIPANGFACHSLFSRSLSIYGAAGAVLDVVVYERPQPAGFGVTNASQEPPATYADGVQTAVAAAAVQVLAANASRRGAVLTNVGSGAVRIGLSTVTAATGFARLDAGQAMPILTGQALYAIREGATSSTVLAAEFT